MKKRWLVTGLLGLLTLACFAPLVWEVYTRRRLRDLLGDPALITLARVHRAEVFRLDPEGPTDPQADGTRIDDYRITATGKKGDEQFAHKLSSVLLDPSTYQFALHNPVVSRSKGCVFRPGVAFRLRKAEDTIEVLLCFNCDEMSIVIRGPTGEVIRQVWADFDPNRPALLRLSREAFPDDEDLRKLPDARH